MSNATFGTLTFYETVTEPTGSNYVISLGEITERAIRRAGVDHDFMGVAGVESTDGGARPRVFEITGEILAAAEAGIVAAKNAIIAEQDGTADTLTVFGEALTGVELLEFEPGSVAFGRLIHMPFRCTFRKL